MAAPVSEGRRAARRTALFLLYQWDLTGQPLTSLFEGEPDPFALSLAEGVAARAEDLDAFIEALEGTGTFHNVLATETQTNEAGLLEAIVEGVYQPSPRPAAAPEARGQ